MLSEVEFDRWCHRRALSQEARDAVAHIRSSPPARRVRSAAGNVSGRYPSRKMGLTIQFESHRVELATIYALEHDADVLEYYDQPPTITLTYPDAGGRTRRVRHTPDFFVLRADAAGWEECKAEGAMAPLATKMPHRYQRGADGQWCCPPGERHAHQLGLYYRVRTSAAINPVYQANLQFLEDYLRAHPLPPTEAARAAMALVAAEPGVTLGEVQRRVADVAPDDLYALIANGHIFVDLHAQRLLPLAPVPAFRDRTTAEAYALLSASTDRPAPPAPHAFALMAGATLLWDGRPWLLLNVGHTTCTLLAEDGRVVDLPLAAVEERVRSGALGGPATPLAPRLPDAARERLAQASPAALATATRRYAVIASSLHPDRYPPAPDDPADPTPGRTRRRWLAGWRQAEQQQGCGFVGLLPRLDHSGNRSRKLPDASLALMAEVIAGDYETRTQKSKRAVYGALDRACQARGLVTPSYKTFAAAVNRRPRHAQVAKRMGPRAAYRHEPFYWELTLTTPRHGTRPWEIAHMDHTELDIELVCSQTGRPLGRPWLSLLLDAFSRRVLALHLTFDPPSYRSCMMLVRACVRRHQRLPQIVVVDGAAEFRSTYFETLLARYECIKKTRPGAKPRFGAVCERLFGTANTHFVHNLVGNTQLTRHSRQVTKADHPREHARWTLGALYERLCTWAYEVYDTLDHPALGQSPRDAYLAGLTQGGFRPQRIIPDDEDFRLSTLPTTPKGTARLHPGRGVKIRYLSYWADAFRDPEVEGIQVPVRYDPFDAGHAYAFVRGRWVECISEYYPQFHLRSEREVMAATAELRQRHHAHAGAFACTARALADFLATIEDREDLALRRLRAAEGRRLSGAGRAGGAAILPAPTDTDAPHPLGAMSASAPPQERSACVLDEDSLRSSAPLMGATKAPTEALEPFEEYV